MKNRIIEFLKVENKSSAQMAEEIGVQPSSISHIVSGRNNPSLDFVLKMLEKYSYLSTEWLLFGKGSMYKEAGMQELFENVRESGTAAFDFGTSERDSVAKEEISGPENAPPVESKKASGIEKIVVFYSDRSFREYYPADK